MIVRLRLALFALLTGCAATVPVAARESQPAVVPVSPSPAPSSRAAPASTVDAASAPVGAWPRLTGMQTVRIHDDGSRDVRLLGYLDAWRDPPEDYLTLASDAIGYARLEARPELVPRIRAIAETGRRAFGGPTRSLLRDLYRGRTMVDAVGTCGNSRATGVAVVIEGRARLEREHEERWLVMEVDRVIATVHVSTWQRLAPTYRAALTSVAQAVARRGALAREDFAPLARFRATLARAYGPAAPLLEIDVVLAALEAAVSDGSVERATAALELRCGRLSDEEERLYQSLRSSTRSSP